MLGFYGPYLLDSIPSSLSVGDIGVLFLCLTGPGFIIRYSIEGGDFDPGVGCIIRAIAGSMSRDDVEVKRLDQLSGVLSLYENEELISNIVHVQPNDKEKSFTVQSLQRIICIN